MARFACDNATKSTMPPKYPKPTAVRIEETLHIYRQLLREISYLPPAFSPSISSLVRQRFHSNRQPGPHDKNRISKAKRTLRNIRLANHGDGQRMLKFMNKGFGRTGPRHYELFEKLRSVEGPQDSDTLEAVTGAAPTDRAAQFDVQISQREKDRQRHKETLWPGQKVITDIEKAIRAERKVDIKAKAAPDPDGRDLQHRWLDNWNRKKLAEFAKSQQQQQAQLVKGGVKWDHGSIRHTHETQFVPEQTTWGKLPTRGLVRTKVAKFWKMQADKLLPPVGKGEWELLEKLSLGAQNQGEWKLPKRRTPEKSLPKPNGIEDWNWEAHAAQKTRAFEPSTLVKPSKRLNQPTSPFTGGTPRNSLSERWFRRQYQAIFLKTAHAVTNPNTLQEQYVWGNQRAYNAKPAPHQMCFFETTENKRPALMFLYRHDRVSPLYSRF